MTIYIKGQCEHCGFAYKGNCPTIDGVFCDIVCPSCRKETQNFDEAADVDARNEEEDSVPDYKESKIELK